MGKNKGRQCGGFPSKAMRASFCKEWQALASEVELKKKQPVSRNRRESPLTNPELTAERPKFRLSHLQNVLQDRVQEDRLREQQVRRQAQRSSAHDSTIKQPQRVDTASERPVPFNTYDDEYDDYRENGLVLLCIRALAPVIQDYIDQMGKETVHHHLSLLPGKTLTALSVEMSTRGLWKSKDVLYAVAHHAHLSRLAICFPNGGASNKITQDELEEALMLQSLSPMNTCRVVPESWEDEVLEEQQDGRYNVDNHAVRRLQRLELRNIPQLSAETVLSLITSCTTHVSLRNVLHLTSGPIVVEQLASDGGGDFYFHSLDVSRCEWATPEILLRLESITLSFLS